MRKRLLLLNVNSRRSLFAGFTLLECLLALFLFSIICLLSSGYAKNAQVTGRHLQNASEKEWHIFLIQLENELEGCTFLSAEADRLTLYDEEKRYTVLIEYKQQKIIKSANGGYQPLLTQVKSAVFNQENQRIQLQLDFENGQSKEVMLTL